MPILIETPVERAESIVATGKVIVRNHAKAYGADSERTLSVAAILTGHKSRLAALIAAEARA